MVMYGWLWTNECCMCARSTHDEVGRFGRVWRRKADFGPVLSSPRGGFGGIWGVMDGPSRAQKLAQRAERRGRPVRSGGTTRSGWGHIRAELGAQPAGGGGGGVFGEAYQPRGKGPGPDSGASFGGNTTAKLGGNGCWRMGPPRGALLGAVWPHCGGTCCGPGGI